MKNKKTTINETIRFTKKMCSGMNRHESNEMLAEAIHPYVYNKVKKTYLQNPMVVPYIRENYGTVSNLSRYVANQLNEGRQINEVLGGAIGATLGSFAINSLSLFGGRVAGSWLAKKVGSLFGIGEDPTPETMMEKLNNMSATELAQIYAVYVPKDLDNAKWGNACQSAATSTSLKPGDGFAKSLLLEILEAYKNSDSQEQSTEDDNQQNTQDTSTSTPEPTTDGDPLQHTEPAQDPVQQDGPEEKQNSASKRDVNSFYKKCIECIKNGETLNLIETIKHDVKNCFFCARDFKWIFHEGQNFETIGAEKNALDLTTGKGVYCKNIDDKYKDINPNNYLVRK